MREERGGVPRGAGSAGKGRIAASTTPQAPQVVVTVDAGPTGLGLTAENWEAALVYCEEAQAPGFVVRDSTLVGVRRWGLLVEARGGVIEDNHISNSSSSAIMIVNGEAKLHGHGASSFDGGFVSSDVLIQRNYFEGCFVQGVTAGSNTAAAVVASTVVGVDLARKDSGEWI
jgi:hypothetical protein